MRVHVSSVLMKPGVGTLPDDFKISPADDVLFAQSHSQSVLELNVGVVYLDGKHFVFK